MLRFWKYRNLIARYFQNNGCYLKIHEFSKKICRRKIHATTYCNDCELRCDGPILWFLGSSATAIFIHDLMKSKDEVLQVEIVDATRCTSLLWIFWFDTLRFYWVVHDCITLDVQNCFKANIYSFAFKGRKFNLKLMKTEDLWPKKEEEPPKMPMFWEWKQRRGRVCSCG